MRAELNARSKGTSRAAMCNIPAQRLLVFAVDLTCLLQLRRKLADAFRVVFGIKVGYERICHACELNLKTYV